MSLNGFTVSPSRGRWTPDTPLPPRDAASPRGAATGPTRFLLVLSSLARVSRARRPSRDVERVTDASTRCTPLPPDGPRGYNPWHRLRTGPNARGADRHATPAGSQPDRSLDQDAEGVRGGSDDGVAPERLHGRPQHPWRGAPDPRRLAAAGLPRAALQRTGPGRRRPATLRLRAGRWPAAAGDPVAGRNAAREP